MATFIYIQKIDTGLAPCVYRGIWTLALCKPTIRRKAAAGDIVIAVTDKADGHKLSSWARINERITTKEFSDRFPKSRLDNIYDSNRAGHFVRRANVKHDMHSSQEHKRHDLGARGENAFVLVSKDFYAFGKDAVALQRWIKNLPDLEAEIEVPGRAFRKHFNENVSEDLQRLEMRLKKEFSHYRKKGFKPRDHIISNSRCESKTEEKKVSCYQDRA